MVENPDHRTPRENYSIKSKHSLFLSLQNICYDRVTHVTSRGIGGVVRMPHLRLFLSSITNLTPSAYSIYSYILLEFYKPDL